MCTKGLASGKVERPSSFGGREVRDKKAAVCDMAVVVEASPPGCVAETQVDEDDGEDEREDGKRGVTAREHAPLEFETSSGTRSCGTTAGGNWAGVQGSALARGGSEPGRGLASSARTRLPTTSVPLIARAALASAGLLKSTKPKRRCGLRRTSTTLPSPTNLSTAPLNTSSVTSSLRLEM